MGKKLRTVVYILIIGIFFLAGYGLGEEITKRDILQNTSGNLNTSSNTSTNSHPNSTSRNGNASLDLQMFWDVWDIINTEYLYPLEIDYVGMQYGATYGLVQALKDPYSVFFEPEITKEFIDSIEGSFEGIGAALYLNEGVITVEYTLKESPAMNAGIKQNDMVYKIDGDITTDMTLKEAVNRIRGEKGSQVVLTVIHEDAEEPTDITVTRDTINLESVSWEMKENNIAYIAINQFVDDTSEEFQKAVSEILKENPTGLILDLRYNPGGYFDQALEIIGEFIDEGVAVKRVYRDSEDEVKVRGNARLSNMKTVVLINSSSASSSEIVAGALQDYGKAQFVGEKTYGKGTIQDFIELPDGASLKITTAKWLTPNGHWVNEEPITPDYEVILTDEDIENSNDTQLKKAMELLSSQ